MNYKVEGAIKKTRKYLIIYAILWLFMVIVFIMPAGVAIKDALINEKFTFRNMAYKVWKLCYETIFKF